MTRPAVESDRRDRPNDEHDRAPLSRQPEISRPAGIWPHGSVWSHDVQVPRQRRLGKISKRGDTYLRNAATHGARSTLHSALRRAPDKAPVCRLDRGRHNRIGYHKTLIAIANKHGRSCGDLAMARIQSGRLGNARERRCSTVTSRRRERRSNMRLTEHDETFANYPSAKCAILIIDRDRD